MSSHIIIINRGQPNTVCESGLSCDYRMRGISAYLSLDEDHGRLIPDLLTWVIQGAPTVELG